MREALLSGEASAAPAQVVAFGPYRVDSARKLLLNGETEVRIGGRSFDLLLALLEKPGEVLGHEELIARAWPRVIVEESSLRVNIGALRKALGDGINGARYIANVPGRGYSFVAPVRKTERTPSSTAILLEAPRNNLPIRLTRVIGRDDAIARVRSQLLKHRLATIVGHGGIGKTTLAIAVAEELSRQFRDGTCFVDLAAQTDPNHIQGALGAALGLAFNDVDGLSHIHAYLAEREMLLVIDNCEHLIDHVASLAESILRAAPKVFLLATSREALHVDGEWIYRLASLQSPPENVPLDCDLALAFPAIQLLVERVEASVDTFSLTRGNLDVAAAVCRKLGGVPLAIEFAAARIGLLGLNGMAAQLEDRLRLLGTGRRTVLPRHRTLRALVDWSYHLLSLDEQLVLRRISIFRGCFTLDSASVVLADLVLTPAIVRDCVLSLVEKSLVSVEFRMDIAYYQLLEITRAFALEKLGEEQEGNELAERHAREVLNLIQRSEQDWITMEAILWQETYLRIMGDLRAALDWSFGPNGNNALGIEITTSVLVRSHHFMGLEEQGRCAERAACVIASGVPVQPLGGLRIDTILRHMRAAAGGSKESNTGNYLEALKLAEQRGRTDEQVEVFYHGFMKAFFYGDHAEADRQASNAVHVATESCDTHSQVHANRMRAQTLHFSGQHVAAQRCAAYVLRHVEDKVPFRFASLVERRLSMGIILARVAWMTGHSKRAKRIVVETLAAVAPEDHPIALCQVLAMGACPVAMWCGDDDWSEQLIERLFNHAAAHSIRDWLLWAQHFKTALSLRRDSEAPAPRNLSGQLNQSLLDHLASFDLRLLSSSVTRRVEQGTATWCAPEVMRLRAEENLSLPQPQLEQADQLLGRAMALSQQQGALAFSLRIAISLARLRLAQKREGDAKSVLENVLTRFPKDDPGKDFETAAALLASLS